MYGSNTGGQGHAVSSGILFFLSTFALGRVDRRWDEKFRVYFFLLSLEIRLDRSFFSIKVC